jgi:hypothetical protein
LLWLFQNHKMSQIQNQYKVWSVTAYILCPFVTFFIGQGMRVIHQWHVRLKHQSVTLTLRSEYRAWHLILLLRTFVLSNFKIPSMMKKLWFRHDIYIITDHVRLWPASVTLTLEVGILVLCTTHCLIIVNICDKFFQNTLMDEKVLDWRKKHILHVYQTMLSFDLPSVTLT